MITVVNSASDDRSVGVLVITCSPGRVGADRFLPSTCNSGFGKGGHTGRSDDGDLQERPRCIDVGRRMERQVGFSITLDFDRPELGPIPFT